MRGRMMLVAPAILAMLVAALALSVLELGRTRGRYLHREAERHGSAGQPLVLPHGPRGQSALLVSGPRRHEEGARSCSAEHTEASAAAAAAPPRRKLPADPTAIGAENDRAAVASAYWPVRKQLLATSQRRRATARPTTEHSALRAQDEMPLVWPVLSAAEVQAAQQPSASGNAHEQMLALIASALALAAIALRKTRDLVMARRLRLRRCQLRAQSAASSTPSTCLDPIRERRQCGAASEPASQAGTSHTLGRACPRRSGVWRAASAPGATLWQLFPGWQRSAA